jgi:N-acetylneuraminate synthase
MNISIGQHEIGAGRVYIIAEIGNNHNGNFERAIQMVDLAAEMGADCAKFQMRQLEEFVSFASKVADQVSGMKHGFAVQLAAKLLG